MSTTPLEYFAQITGTNLGLQPSLLIRNLHHKKLNIFETFIIFAILINSDIFHFCLQFANIFSQKKILKLLIHFSISIFNINYVYKVNNSKLQQ